MTVRHACHDHSAPARTQIAHPPTPERAEPNRDSIANPWPCQDRDAEHTIPGRHVDGLPVGQQLAVANGAVTGCLHCFVFAADPFSPLFRSARVGARPRDDRRQPAAWVLRAARGRSAEQ
jgi:hypothetical protein